MAFLTGTEADDQLIGADDNDLIDGLGGDDDLQGSGGFDVLNGGSGNDLLDGGRDDDLLNGGDGNDVARGGLGADGIDGGTGDDSLFGDDGDDVLIGGAGADTLDGGAGNDILWSGERNLGSVGYTGRDDLLNEVDNLSGGIGDDQLWIGYGDSADGGTGTDILRLSLSGAPVGLELDTKTIADDIAAAQGNRSYTDYGLTVTGVEQLRYLRGSEFADVITATAGSVVVQAGGGNDLIVTLDNDVRVSGGDGNDRFVSSGVGSVLNGDGGTNTVDYLGSTVAAGLRITLGLASGAAGIVSNGDRLANIQNVDASNFADIVSGSDAANVLRGYDGDDRLEGNAGNDSLIGGSGADEMLGGRGNDGYVVEDAADRVVEVVGEGTDTIYTTTSYALERGSAVEVLTVYERATTDALRLIGNELAQTIYGNAGNNLIAGGGGADVLYGGGGDDAFLVDGPEDRVIEFVGGGTDTIYTTGNFTLSAGSEVETVTVYDRATTNATNLNGNELAQRIYGNDGVNGLRSGGGADILYGLGGDDHFVIDSADAQVIEFAGGGYDTVYAAISYVLGYDAAVEVLTAYDRAGTAALNLNGNAFGQTVYGNGGVNFLNGGGGADILFGLGGNDGFLVDGLDDQVIEFAGGGYDTVYATGSFALGMDAEVETLTVYDRTTRNALNLTGSGTANRIIGNDGVNVIDGKGGADTLFGLGGADTFAFSTALGADNVDTVIGFVSGSDRIRLSSTIFAGLAPGDLAPGAFATGSIATESDDRILYDRASGALLYDPDGNGSAIATRFALFDPETLLTAGDFLIV